jgi:hypothetical protein
MKSIVLASLLLVLSYSGILTFGSDRINLVFDFTATKDSPFGHNDVGVIWNGVTVDVEVPSNYSTNKIRIHLNSTHDNNLLRFKTGIGKPLIENV